MTISRTEAVAALSEADDVGRRTRRAGAYAMASPHLILWGVVWFVGYVATGLTEPRLWGLVWLPLVLAGAIGAMLIGWRSRSRGARAGASAAGSFVMVAAVGALFASVYYLFQPTTPAPYLVLPALITAFLYVLIGVFGFPRFGWIGCAIFVASMGSYIFAEPLLPFCIALAGGGGLILGGIWFSRI